MCGKIRIGILGYGNLGRGVERALAKCDDMVLKAVFSRRDPAQLKLETAGVSVFSVDRAKELAGEIDVLLLCGGSATDLPEQGPVYAKWFHTVDSFDTHARIPEYFAAMDTAAKEGGHLAMISVGWDPGLFSINRVISQAVLPEGDTYTFWGRGVSQGHSDAIRRVEGVADAIQYTVPIPEALEAVRSGSRPALTTGQKHRRECYVVPKEGADLEEITKTIREMPNYFADYETTVHFVSEEILRTAHAGMPHGGFVLHSGVTGAAGNKELIEYGLTLDSNPEFTGSVLVCCARAVYRMAARGESGARTILDVSPAMLSPKSGEALRAEML